MLPSGLTVTAELIGRSGIAYQTPSSAGTLSAAGRVIPHADPCAAQMLTREPEPGTGLWPPAAPAARAEYEFVPALWCSFTNRGVQDVRLNPAIFGSRYRR